MKNKPSELVDDLSVLRIIHSNKAIQYEKWNTIYLIVTIVVAVIVTFIGFTNSSILNSFFANNKEFTNSEKMSLIINLMILAILIVTILGPILKFEKKASKHNFSVIQITELISDVQFQYPDPDTSSFKTEDIEKYSNRYKSLICSLPPTTDADYYKALMTKVIKEKKKDYINGSYSNDNLIKRIWTLLWI